MLAFSACMREHGVDYPDPDVSGGGISIEIGGPDAAGGIDPSSEKFQAAQEACAAETARRPVQVRRRSHAGVEAVRPARLAGAGLVLMLAAGVVAAAAGGTSLPSGTASAAASPSDVATADMRTAAVDRGTVKTTADLAGKLGYEGSGTVAAGAAGTLTRLPALGDVIERGEALYELDGRTRPRLLYGDRPLWRPLDPDVSDGADVLQLEQNLKAMGYASKRMKVDRHWDARTTAAVKRWQKATGRTRDGSLDGWRPRLPARGDPGRLAAGCPGRDSRVRGHRSWEHHRPPRRDAGPQRRAPGPGRRGPGRHDRAAGRVRGGGHGP